MKKLVASLATVLPIMVLAALRASAGVPHLKPGTWITPAELKAPGLHPVMRLESGDPELPVAAVYGTEKLTPEIQFFKPTGHNVPTFDHLYVVEEFSDGTILVKFDFTEGDEGRWVSLFDAEDVPIVGNVNVLALRFSYWGSQGVTADLRILRDATNVARSKRVTRSVDLSVENSSAIARYKNNEFYNVRVIPREIGGQQVGVEKLVFFTPDGKRVAASTTL